MEDAPIARAVPVAVAVRLVTVPELGDEALSPYMPMCSTCANSTNQTFSLRSIYFILKAHIE